MIDSNGFSDIWRVEAYNGGSAVIIRVNGHTYEDAIAAVKKKTGITGGYSMERLRVEELSEEEIKSESNDNSAGNK